jgi:hypothetical protein
MASVREIETTIGQEPGDTPAHAERRKRQATHLHSAEAGHLGTNAAARTEQP